ncbi:MAG: 16S rRNA (guanine(966)-N(2))-methyltransferase RsmD [Deltaproteobacteria bacterium]|jgi:16S rRNA (guanine(966)-N(2))-methyltransferase RsmD|nr:16S rRNA (guanine(966)-N(2))-methyltransferase RsmD [Deltaproteobacteria bacterium]
MPKIITGLFKGLNLNAPKDLEIRPTAAPVREAIFSILDDIPLGAAVLDLYAGTGAMGLEALSRGAEKVLFCDKSPQAITTIVGNLKKIPARLLPKTEVMRATFPKDFSRLSKQGPFSLILLDPPYADNVFNVISFLNFAAQTNLASPQATAVWEQSPKSLSHWAPQDLPRWELALTRRWGKKAAAILKLPA